MKKITTLCATLMLTAFGLHLNAQTISSFPYYENFEGESQGPTNCGGAYLMNASGWTNDLTDGLDWSSDVGGTGSTNTGPTTNSGADHNPGVAGGHYMYTETSGAACQNATANLESPFFNLTALTQPELALWYHMFGANMGGALTHIDARVGSTAAWTIDVVTPVTDNQDVWQELIVDLIPYAGMDSVQFRVRGTTGSSFGSDIAIDDIKIWQIPTCPQPIALTALNITAFTADLFWSEAASATSWDVELDTTGFTPTGTPTSAGLTDTTLTAASLLGNTTYQYYVRAICSASDSSYWAGPYSFTTLCSTYQAPYFEGFEANGLDCWSITSTSTGFSSYNWLQNSGTTGSFGTGPNGASSGSEYIYTEASSGSSGDSTRLESPIIDLTSIVNSQLKFDYHMFGVKIDTLYIQVNNGAGFVTIDSITGAQQNATADAWLTKVIDLSAYDGSTNFQVAFVIKSLGCCDGDISIDNIRIAETCVMPTSAIISSLTSSSTSLGWTTSGSAAVTWSIEYGPTGFIQGTGSVINTTFNPHPLVGLPDATTYDFYIISNCALGDKSPWAGPFNFTTFITGVDENTANNGVSIFPNPNNGVFSLKVNASDATVKVMNTQGQIILTKNILKNNAKIDLSNNAKGIYFVTVASENGVSTHKVSVQ